MRSHPVEAGRPQRDAAAVLLSRGDGDSLEVLLVERSPELRFFGGYMAFPGGVVDSADQSSADDMVGENPFRRCALRELFEETGILLDAGLRSGAGAAELEAIRADLLAVPSDVLAAQRFHQLRAGLTTGDPLREFARLVTPPFAPVCYDTRFYHAELPVGEAFDLCPGELVAGQFWRPQDALDAWRCGRLAVVPPVVLLLQLLVAAGELESFFDAAAERSAAYLDGGLHQVHFMPGVVLASLATPTLAPATTTNCLIVGESRLYVIDPAAPDPAEQRRLFDLLDCKCAEGAELAGILVTHHHPDHVGAVVATSMRYGIPVRAHALTLPRLASGFRVGVPIEDGERIELGRAPDGSEGWYLEAVYSPGHDRGHLCFRESCYDSLIAGDMVSAVATIVIDPPEGDLAVYLQSLERLLAMPVATLFPAHGPPVRDGHALLRRFIAHRARREQALVAALEEHGEASLAELLPLVYPDLAVSLYGYAERSLLAGLEKLRDEGRSTALGQCWRLTAQ